MLQLSEGANTIWTYKKPVFVVKILSDHDNYDNCLTTSVCCIVLQSLLVLISEMWLFDLCLSVLGKKNHWDGNEGWSHWYYLVLTLTESLLILFYLFFYFFKREPMTALKRSKVLLDKAIKIAWCLRLSCRQVILWVWWEGKRKGCFSKCFCLNVVFL